LASAFDILDTVAQGLSPQTTSIQEFAEGSNFCNRPLYPRQVVLLKLLFLEEMTGPEEDVLTDWINGGRNGSEIIISPNIRERREYLRAEGYRHFREVQLVGGRRSSKGFVTGLAMAKVMWDTLQLGDPGEHYGIPETKEIYFSCVAGSETQAKEFQYADFVSTVETCKAMEPYLVKSLETEFRVATNADLRTSSALKAAGNNKILRDMAHLRGKALAANAGTLRGSATMCIAIDEMAHMIAGESKASAQEVYTAADPSLDQFGLDGMMFLNSSPYTKVGKFYEVYELNLMPFDPEGPIEFGASTDEDGPTNADPRNFVFQFPSWALFQHYLRYKSRYKQRERGKIWDKAITVSPDWNPAEVDREGDPLHSPKDQQNIVAARAKESANPESYKVERRGKFAEVTDAYLNPTLVDQMYRGVPNGYDYFQNGDIVRKLSPLFTNLGSGALNLYRYKFHIDPSSTTAGFGFAIAHIEYFPNITTGIEEEHVVFDLIKSWEPVNFPGKVIRWDPILKDIAFFAEIFRPFEITFDQHQSSDPIQRLQETLTAKNIQTRVYEKFATNELNWKRWEVFKTALYQGLIHAPGDEVPKTTTPPYTSRDELKFLQEIRTGGKFSRIEKQDLGPIQTKDMADCIAECTYSLIGNLMVTRMRDRLSTSSIYGGSPGGYGIGQGGPPMGRPTPPGISEYYSRREQRVDPSDTRAALTRGAIGGRRRSASSANRARGRW
jgi:hypothetical protein